MNWIYHEVGRRLRKAREAARLTQDALAKRVGLCRTSITNIECGRQHIPLHTLYLLASAVGATATQLLPESLPSTPEEHLIPKDALRKWPTLAAEGQEWVRRVVRSGS